jgi:hypothetical protein
MDTGYAPKNKIVPHIIKGFFTEEEIIEILAIVERQKVDESLDSFYRPLVLQELSRSQIEVMYPTKIKEKLEKFASELVGEELFMYHNSYLSYNLEHNSDSNPKLPVHYDSDNYFSKLTMDYQLGANIDWPIVIEGESFNLQYGDLLIFWGAGQVHWRKPVLFKEGDNTEVLTMHFSKKEDFETLNISSRNIEAREERLARWNNIPEYARYKEEYAKQNEVVRLQRQKYKKIKQTIKTME